MEANNKRRIGGLKDKIPDIQKTLETVRFLQKRDVSVCCCCLWCKWYIIVGEGREKARRRKEKQQTRRKESTHAHFANPTTHHHSPGRLRTPRSNIRTQRHPLRQSPHSSHPRSLFMAWRKSLPTSSPSLFFLLLFFSSSHPR